MLANDYSWSGYVYFGILPCSVLCPGTMERSLVENKKDTVWGTSQDELYHILILEVPHKCKCRGGDIKIVVSKGMQENQMS